MISRNGWKKTRIGGGAFSCFRKRPLRPQSADRISELPQCRAALPRPYISEARVNGEEFRMSVKRPRSAGSDDALMKVDPDSSSSRSNTRDSESCVAKTAIEPPLPTAPSCNATIPVRETPSKVDALLPAIVENAVTIKGRVYITTEQLASLLDVSERTLHRSFEDGKGPPKIKLAGVFYELDEVLKWAADQGRPIKRTAFVDNDDKV
jgi:hypothetical protein